METGSIPSQSSLRIHPGPCRSNDVASFNCRHRVRIQLSGLLCSMLMRGSSLNVDFMIRTTRVPEPGETLAADSFDTGFGGKGANQAVAAARLSASDVEVRMVGKVGNDIFGLDYLKGLEKERIVHEGVQVVQNAKTGVSTIIVDDSTGENRILFTANANNAYPEQQNPSWDIVPGAAQVVVFQLEIPLPVVLRNMHLARQAGKHVIFNPAPATPIPDSAYSDIDTLIMNETESQILGSVESDATDQTSPIDLAQRFLQRGVKEAVIITLGGQGLAYATASGESGNMPAKKVKVVDTTAAGDTFVGAYAVKRAQMLGQTVDYRAALDFAILGASKSVEKAGAMAAIPYLSELS